MGKTHIWNGMLALLSAVISLSCVGLGAIAFSSPEAPAMVFIFGTFLVAYGLLALVLLGMAFWRPSPLLAKVSKISGIAFFAILFVGSLDVGQISGLEFALLAFVGGVLWLQFVAVRRLSGYQGA